ERQRVRPDLALVDQALLRLMQEFDRVLDREDVSVFAFVDVVDHRGQRGRLARPGRAGDQDQSARPSGQVGEDLRRVQLLERQHLRRNRPERDRRAALLVERVDAKARQIGDAERKVALSISSYVFRCASLMMSYTMACTSSCSIGGRLMRRMSPCTRMSGGSPADRCRSDALFFTAKARSSVMSILYNPRPQEGGARCSMQ